MDCFCLVYVCQITYFSRNQIFNSWVISTCRGFDFEFGILLFFVFILMFLRERSIIFYFTVIGLGEIAMGNETHFLVCVLSSTVC